MADPCEKESVDVLQSLTDQVNTKYDDLPVPKLSFAHLFHKNVVVRFLRRFSGSPWIEKGIHSNLQEREDLTSSGQHALRLISFGKVAA